MGRLAKQSALGTVERSAWNRVEETVDIQLQELGVARLAHVALHLGDGRRVILVGAAGISAVDQLFFHGGLVAD